MKILACLLSLVLCLPAVAAPKPDLWARWQKHNPAGDTVVEHRAWDDFLRAYRREKDGVALLDYGGVSESDRRSLQDYLKLLSETAVDELNRDEQRAYWINVYNAVTIEVILSEYPVDSIRDISSGFLASGPWNMELFSVAGETLTLNDIEHRILRPIWNDPRLHYAVNCASIGCPNLAATAYTADNTEELLDEGARAYINHARGAAVQNGRLTVSSIYEWFKVDFGDDDAGVIAHLKEYAEPPLRTALDGVQSIGDDHYDWSLNTQ